VSDKYQISIFSGGRGAATIISALAEIEEISLTVLLNAYDDGMSTGYMRKLFPGMLGPSDVRKAFSNVLKSKQFPQDSYLSNLLEYRIGTTDRNGKTWNINQTLPAFTNFWHGEEFLNSYFENLPLIISKSLNRWTENAMNSIFEKIGPEKMRESLADVSFGNVLFVGAYLENGQDFNKAIECWKELFKPRANILNVTDGENKYLVGVKENGKLLLNEAEIVSKHTSAGKISRVFLLDEYLDTDELLEIQSGTLESIIQKISSLEALPKLNAKAKLAIDIADMIVYGPGTQYSSLLPSYMTKGLSNAVRDNQRAEKVFISNIAFDHDIVEENHESLMGNLVEYMNIGSSENARILKPDLITRTIVSSGTDLKFDMSVYDNSTDVNNLISFGKWAADQYTHDGDRVSRALLTIASMDTKLFENQSLKSISIVIPVLDEIKTLDYVLNQVITFDWLGEGYVPQIIVVDGGSTDGSWEHLKKIDGILTLKLKVSKGRGAALREGLLTASGDVAVTFPADNEYSVGAILDVARSLANKEVGIVFGSRSTLCADTDARLIEIYGGRTREYFLSKWGGMLLSIISAIRFRRWISDPLTSIKGFKGNEHMKLSFDGDSLDWDTRVIADSWVSGIPIMEIPVQYVPRTRQQGKKTTVMSGLVALMQLLHSRRKS